MMICSDQEAQVTKLFQIPHVWWGVYSFDGEFIRLIFGSYELLLFWSAPATDQLEHEKLIPF